MKLDLFNRKELRAYRDAASEIRKTLKAQGLDTDSYVGGPYARVRTGNDELTALRSVPSHILELKRATEAAIASRDALQDENRTGYEEMMQWLSANDIIKDHPNKSAWMIALDLLRSYTASPQGLERRLQALTIAAEYFGPDSDDIAEMAKEVERYLHVEAQL